jgi:hypothetical protein
VSNLDWTGILPYAMSKVPAEQLDVCIAIALAESGGNPRAVNRNRNGSTDRGLWQINSVHKQFDPDRLFDPDYNAEAMAVVSKGGTDWTPWVAYTSGAYKRHLSGLEGGQATPGKVAGDVLADPLGAVSAFLSMFTSWATWQRVLQVIAGLGAIVVGLRMLGQDLIGQALDAAPIPTPKGLPA